MKKLSKTFLGLAVCACTAVSIGLLAACGDEEPTGHTHNYGEWSVTKPTEENEGYAAKTCSVDGCDKKTITVTLPVLGDEAYSLSDNTATCEEAGEATYSYTKDGNTVTFTAETAATGHVNLEKTDEEPKSCETDGVAAYWTCADCDKMFSDENAETEIEEPAVIPHSHAETLFHNEAYPADCGRGGTAEYWTCLDCYQDFSDEDGENPIDEPQSTPKDPAVHRVLQHMDAMPANCTNEGFEEYWYCPGCLQKYSDEEGTTEIDKPVAVPVTHSTLTHVDEVATTCAKAGTAEYWYCPSCNQKFSDEDGENKIAAPAEIPTAHTPGNVISGTMGGSFTYPYGITAGSSTDYTQTNIDYYVCGVCSKKFADAACTKEVTNLAKYVSRGGMVLTTGLNTTCTTGTNFNAWFQAEEAGIYAFTADNCIFGTITLIGESADTANGVTVYNGTAWVAGNKYEARFARNDATGGKTFYVDMKEGELLRVSVKYTANTVFGCNVQKLENENILVVGTSEITVSEAQNENGVEWTFTSPAEGYYQISVLASSKAYVMIEESGTKKAVLSAEEGKISYVFHAARGEEIAFFMSVDTMSGSVTFPATYNIAIKETTLPTVVIGEAAQEQVACSDGDWNYEFLVEASEAGTYQLCFKANGNGLLRNYYNLYVNGVKVAQFQAPVPRPADGIWRIDLPLLEGINTVKIENAMPQNASGNAEITVIEKA